MISNIQSVDNSPVAHIQESLAISSEEFMTCSVSMDCDRSDEPVRE